MSITGVIFGVLLIVLGVLALKFNYQLTNNFGSFGSLTQFLGTGNEYAVFKILAILLIIAGFVTTFGLGDNIVEILLSPLKTFFPSAE